MHSKNTVVCSHWWPQSSQWQHLESGHDVEVLLHVCTQHHVDACGTQHRHVIVGPQQRHLQANIVQSKCHDCQQW